jgi:hypothetical protein
MNVIIFSGQNIILTEYVLSHLCNPAKVPIEGAVLFKLTKYRKRQTILTAPLAKRHKISITRGRSPGLSQEHM